MDVKLMMMMMMMMDAAWVGGQSTDGWMNDR